VAVKIKSWIKDLPEYIPGKTIDEIKKKYSLDVVYKLASNENIFGPSPKVMKVLKESLPEVNYYPDSYNRDLRKKLSEKIKISEDCLVFGNGTDQLIDMICDLILEKNKNTVIPDPTFLTYEKSSLKNNAQIVKIPLKDFRQDVEAIIKNVNKDTAIIFLTSPHNPTGTILYDEEVKYILENVSKDILVVLDEAYMEFVPEDKKIDSLKYLKEYENFMVLRTFSKIYGLAGLRIGYGIANADLIKSISKLVQPFVVNLLAQKAALAALDDDDYINEKKMLIITEREKLEKVLEEASIRYVKSYANFILIKTGPKTPYIVEDFLKEGFIVRDGEFLGFPGYIRVSMSTPEINDKFNNLLLKVYRDYYELH